MADKKDAALYYMKKNKILELFDNMTTAMVYERPDDPKMFMADYLKRLHSSRITKFGYPCLFDEENITSMFGILDPAGKGFITHTQFKEAMKSFGVDTYNRNPPGAESDKIDLNTFTQQM